MPPDGGQPIVNTMLAVILAKKDNVPITEDWKAEVVKTFGKEEVLEAWTILKNCLDKQSKVKKRRETKDAMNDIFILHPHVAARE